MRLPTEKIKKIERTGIRKVFDKARNYESQGRRIIHMEIGRPDFDTPLLIKDEAIRSMQAGNVHYTSNFGMDSLKEAIADKLKTDNNILADPQKEIIVTAGAVEGLALAMLALIDTGDEVLIPSPAFSSNENQTIHPGGIPIPVPLWDRNGFVPDLADLEARVTEKTKMLVINTPNNPTGVVYNRRTMEDMAAFAIKHDLMVLSDECYEDIIFDQEHISIASLPGMKERTVTVNSTSKAFSLTGWRVGFVCSPAEVIDYMIRIHQDLVICACSFAQEGAAMGYRNRKAIIPPMVESFRKRRDLVLEHLGKIDVLEFVKPEGGFYVFPSIKKLRMGDWEFCDYILDEAGVAVVPGHTFGKYGEGFFRLAYSCSYEDLDEGLMAMRKAIEKLPR